MIHNSTRHQLLPFRAHLGTFLMAVTKSPAEKQFYREEISSSSWSEGREFTMVGETGGWDRGNMWLLAHSLTGQETSRVGPEARPDYDLQSLSPNGASLPESSTTLQTAIPAGNHISKHMTFYIHTSKGRFFMLCSHGKELNSLCC